jgi:magnesium chelatase accessory protein
VVGRDDKAVKPSDAEKARTLLANARVRYLGGLGHLAHEERPEVVANLIFKEADDVGVLAPL